MWHKEHRIFVLYQVHELISGNQ
jgi:hypothetical protein